MIRILTIAVFINTVVTQILLEFIQMNRFFLLFINQTFSAVKSYSICFLLTMELTSSSHTSFACGLSLISYTLGEIVLTLFAYISRHWLTLKWMISVYFGLLLPYLHFLPESPYWLLSQRKYSELELLLRRMASKNGYSDKNWYPLYHKLISRDNFEEITKTKETKSNSKKYFQKYIPRLLISGLIQFITMLLYTKISYGLAASNTTFSPYVNFIFGAFVEAIGYLLAAIAIITSLGRKYSLILFSSLTSICILIIPLTMKEYPFLTVIISQLGKLSVSSTVSVSWTYFPELFPTTMRGLANAIFVFVGSFGSVLAPIIEEVLGQQYVKYSFYIYSSSIIILAFTICTLPETRNHSFDDEQVDHEHEQQIFI